MLRPFHMDEQLATIHLNTKLAIDELRDAYRDRLHELNNKIADLQAITQEETTLFGQARAAIELQCRHEVGSIAPLNVRCKYCNGFMGFPCDYENK